MQGNRFFDKRQKGSQIRDLTANDIHTSLIKAFKTSLTATSLAIRKIVKVNECRVSNLSFLLFLNPHLFIQEVIFHVDLFLIATNKEALT